MSGGEVSHRRGNEFLGDAANVRSINKTRERYVHQRTGHQPVFVPVLSRNRYQVDGWR